MKGKEIIALVLLLLPAVIFAQNDDSPPKYALVIGNGAYSNLSRLANPVNDADDIGLTLIFCANSGSICENLC